MAATREESGRRPAVSSFFSLFSSPHLGVLASWRFPSSLSLLILYALLALALLFPFRSGKLAEAGDIINHVAGIIEAKAALLEGQFPLRVAPHQVGGMRYPLFQYYGNFPYPLGGLLSL